MNKMNYRSIYRSFFPPSEEYERIVPRTVVPTDATHHPFHLKTLSLSFSLAILARLKLNTLALPFFIAS